MFLVILSVGLIYAWAKGVLGGYERVMRERAELAGGKSLALVFRREGNDGEYRDSWWARRSWPRTSAG